MEIFNAHSPGKLRVGLLLFLTLLVGGVYLGFQLIPYWMDAYDMKNFLDEKARTGQLVSDDEIRGSIIAKAHELGIELSDRDIDIHRSSTDMSISTAWELDYNFFGLYTHTFTFAPQVNVNYQ